MKHFIFCTIIIAITSLSGVYAQCTGGTFGSALTPTAAYKTVAITSYRYYTMNVNCGSRYNFTFCSNGGTSAWDTQITILNSTGTTTLAYNDDFCGVQSEVSYTPNFTGSIRILISLYNCSTSTANTATLAYNVNTVVVSSAFTLTANGCSNANSTVTGTIGGTFSFNPAPADGATINASTGAVSNGVGGASYTVQYTVCSMSTTQSVTLPSTNCWNLNGNAQNVTIGGDPCIQLTGEVNNQTGCAWSNSEIDFNSSFSLSLDYYFGDNINGADGSTFTFQPNPGACGTNGGQLGAGGIPNSLVIEFDTYDNDNPTHAVDIAADHISVEIDGDLQNSSHLCGPVAAKPSGASIDDGVVYPVNIQWDAVTKTLSIYFNGVLRITCNYDFVANVFGGDNTVYWGATAATGGLNNQQYFCPETVVILPTELSSFTSLCADNGTIVKWTSVSEKDLDYYVLEYSFDGFIYYPFKKSHGTGNSTDIKHYSLDISEIARNKPYLRLKMVDFNGDVKNTEIIKTADCSGNDYKVETQSIVNNILQLHSVNGKDFSFDLIDLQGKIVLSGQSSDGNVTQETYLAKGVYIINTQFPNTNYSQQEKVISY